MAATSVGDRVRVVLSGPPDAVEGVVPIAPQRRRSIAVKTPKKGEWPGRAPRRMLTSPLTDEASVVRLILPTSTPPGTYSIQLECDGTVIDADVVVEPESRLTVRPPVLRVAGRRREGVTVDLEVTNGGNRSIQLGQRHAFGVLETNGIDAAIGAALRPRKTTRSRWDIFADELAEHRGGLARLLLPALEPLEPGATIRTTATIRLHDHAVPGHEYHGLWRLEDARVPVYIRMTKSEPRRRQRKEPS
jgi:hypothetical protein